MLVLTRKQRQQITIGDNITITVLRVKGQAVRIGIEAPSGIRVLRAELNSLDKMTVENDALPEELPIVGTVQRTENNARRSRVGKQSTPSADRLESSPARQPKVNPSHAPLAGVRMAPVSLLSFR